MTYFKIYQTHKVMTVNYVFDCRSNHAQKTFFSYDNN